MVISHEGSFHKVSYETTTSVRSSIHHMTTLLYSGVTSCHEKYWSNLIWCTVTRLIDELISSLRVSCDPTTSAHPLDLIPSARSSYYSNNVYVSTLRARWVFYSPTYSPNVQKCIFVYTATGLQKYILIFFLSYLFPRSKMVLSLLIYIPREYKQWSQVIDSGPFSPCVF